jgi:uncharacterized membrane protein YbhN (UPF0104 family)
MIMGWTAISWIASVTQMISLMIAFSGEGHVRAILLAISIASLAVAIPAVPGNVGPFEAAIIFGLILGGAAKSDGDSRAAAYAIFLHFMNVALYAILGIIGIFQEKISFGELLQSARQIATRSEATPQPES